MPQEPATQRIDIIRQALLAHDGGDTAEAIDVHLGHPAQDVFERYITALAATIDAALTAGKTST